MAKTTAAAQAFWNGAWERFDAACDKKMPKSLGIESAIRECVVRTGRNRDGIGFRGDMLHEWRRKVGFQSFLTKGAVMIQEVADEAANKANASMEGLLRTVEKFHGGIKNDLSSMKAASDRVETEVRRMSKAYTEAASVLTSAQFTEAVANAERLAAALEKISALRGQRLDIQFLADPS